MVDNISYPQTITLAMTGASGAAYGIRLLECLLQARRRVYFLISDAARTVVKMELGVELPSGTEALELFLSQRCKAQPGQLRVFGSMDWLAPSGIRHRRQDSHDYLPCIRRGNFRYCNRR
jgi:4-hydroxy-3-polyprenylbenzoate decarboxylase